MGEDEAEPYFQPSAAEDLKTGFLPTICSMEDIKVDFKNGDAFADNEDPFSCASLLAEMMALALAAEAICDLRLQITH